MARKLKKLLLLSSFLLLALLNPLQAEAYNWCGDAYACWLMDIDEDPLTDSSGNSRPLTKKSAGEPSFDLGGGQFDNAYSFDGGNDFADNAAMQSFASEQGTITIWAQSDAATLSSNNWFVGRNAGGNNAGDLGFFIDNDDSEKYAFLIQDGSSTIFIKTTGTLDDTDYHHLAGVWDKNGGAGSSKIYFDGVLQTDTGAAIELKAHAALDFTIGNQNDAGGDAWDGSLDEIGVFVTVLTRTNINDILDNGLYDAAAAPTFVPKMMMF